MNDYNISDYGIFNDAVTTTKDCNNKIATAQTGINECKTIISDGSVLMGPIQEKCSAALQELDTNCTSIITNLESISTYLINTSSTYQTADNNANNTITGTNEAPAVQQSIAEPQPTGSGNFTKYNLTENQLKQLTAIALHEQGTAKGAAAEASLMANLFELRGSKFGTGADGLENYVRSSGWFANANNHMNDTGIVTDEAYNAVKSVLVDGKRTLPKYIDEHDYLGDLTSVKTNGTEISVKDKSNYKQFETQIKNRYGSSYTFYSFPDTNSDPFGYTSEENRKKFGEECYAYEG